MSSRPLDRPERVGPYVLTELLAQGVTSYVLGATYDGPAGFTQSVAIKTLRGEALRSPVHVRDFVTEARAAATVAHPGIAQVHALLEAGDLPLLVMERVRGWSLRGVCATLSLTRRLVVPHVAVTLVRDAALAADALHEAGVVHRNLSPDNLMVTATGHAKVIDFGAASGEAIERPHIVSIDGPYAAPEITRGLRDDRTCDVYSLGAVLHELCVGVPPPATGRPTWRDARSGTAELLPTGLAAVIERALRYSPDERFVSAADFAEALDDVTAHHAWRASPPIVAAYLAHVFATRRPARPSFRRAPSETGRTRVRVRRAN